MQSNLSFKDKQFTIVKDEQQPGFRLLVATTSEGKTYLQTAFWKEGAKRYYACGAFLSKESASALPAFEIACRAFKPAR